VEGNAAEHLFDAADEETHVAADEPTSRERSDLAGPNADDPLKLYVRQIGDGRLLGQKLNRDPSLDEIAAEIGITPERVQDLLELVLDPVSLETPIGDGDSSVADLIPDTSAQQPEVETADRARSSELLDALAKLQPRQRRVVVGRFGLDGVRPRTLEEVGANLGITRERVRQLEARALRELRAVAPGLELYLRA